MGFPDYAISIYEFDVLWAELCLGRMPWTLEVPRTGQTVAEQTLLAEETNRELVDRGLVDRANKVDEGLAAALVLLSDYRVAVEFVGDIGYPVRALAASDGRTGVLAVLAGGELWLTGIQPAELATAMVGLLPPERRAEASPRHGVHSPAPTSAPAGSACGAAGRFEFSTGVRGRARASVTWFDTDNSRYFLVDQNWRLFLLPADRVAIEQRIAAILSVVDVGWSALDTTAPDLALLPVR
jgi:hypothetical protein